jgi:endonuclease/exonuclease/phosphatase family metal-dependent hydrolase
MRYALTSAALAVGIATAAHVAARVQPPRGDATIKVMTFNIQHGIDGSHKYNLQRAVEVIARIQPDIVGLQEVTRNHPYYNCDDQPAKIADGLKAATGRQWSVAYEQEWFTPNVECQQSGRGDGKETEGLAFLAPGPLGSTSMIALPVSRIAFAVRPPVLGGVPVIVTHLASGRQNGDARRKEVDALVKWVQSLGPAQILIGDFNARPGDPELEPLLPMFRDGWQVASHASAAKGGEATHGQHRIDYVFYRSEGLELTGIETIDTAGWLGKAASDHKPLVATFRVRPRG